jgi:hypothetical protein
MPNSAPGISGRTGQPPVATRMYFGGDALAVQFHRMRVHHFARPRISVTPALTSRRS